MELPVRNSHRGSGDEDPLLSFCKVHAVCDSLLELVAQLVDHSCESLRVIIVSDLRDEQHVGSADRYILFPSEAVQSLESSSLCVDLFDVLCKSLRGYFVACCFFYYFDEFFDLVCPLQKIFFSLHLRQVHDVHRHVGPEDLVSFLFAVACSLADIDISQSVERACPVESCAEHSLDERACVGRKISLSARYPELRACAETGSDTACCEDHFVRNISAECTEYLAAVLSEFYEFGRSESVDVREHHIEIVHSFRPVLL